MTIPQTLKGFRDFLPPAALQRKWLIAKIVEVFEKFGFDPLETPAIEYSQILMGKYGEEADKLLYCFDDRGGRNVSLRYDQTVPTARVIAMYPELAKPFKRYQLQTVWRAEKPQKGRYREFLQCDADIIGSTSPISDAEITTLVYSVMKNIGFTKFTILVNDRQLFGNAPLEAIRIIDKLTKIGKEEVKKQLALKGFSQKLIDEIEKKQPTENLQKIIGYCENLGVDKNYLKFEPTLARGLDYYTSTIFEVVIEDFESGSVCGGGRYDKLIGLFSKSDIPAVGFAFGFDRLLQAANDLKITPNTTTNSKVLVTIFSEELIEISLQITSDLRNNGISAEIYPDANKKLDKQLKYADKKRIPWVIIIGPDEAKLGTVVLKNLAKKQQFTFLRSKIATALKNN